MPKPGGRALCKDVPAATAVGQYYGNHHPQRALRRGTVRRSILIEGGVVAKRGGKELVRQYFAQS